MKKESEREKRDIETRERDSEKRESESEREPEFVCGCPVNLPYRESPSEMSGDEQL